MEFNVQRSEESILTLLVASKGRLMLFVPNPHVPQQASENMAPQAASLPATRRRPCHNSKLGPDE